MSHADARAQEWIGDRDDRYARLLDASHRSIRATLHKHAHANRDCTFLSSASSQRHCVCDRSQRVACKCIVIHGRRFRPSCLWICRHVLSRQSICLHSNQFVSKVFNSFANSLRCAANIGSNVLGYWQALWASIDTTNTIQTHNCMTGVECYAFASLYQCTMQTT